MKFTKNTIKLLKNMLPVNQQLMLRPGNKIFARNANNSMFVVITLPDEEAIESEMAIYDLAPFVRMLSMFGDDVLLDTSNSGYVKMHNDKYSITYRLTDPSLIKHQVTKAADIKDHEFVFSIDAADIDRIQTLAAHINATHIMFDETGIEIYNKKDKSADRAKINMDIPGFASIGKRVLNFEHSPINLMGGDYDVYVSTTPSCMKFQHKTESMYVIVGVSKDD